MKQDPLKKRGEIHLGDLARALGDLNCETPEQTDAIASCLGFAIEKKPDAKPSTEIYDHHRYPPQTRSQPTKPELPKGFSAPPEPEPPVALPDTVVTSQLQKLEPRTPPAPHDPDWLDEDYEMLVTGSEPAIVARAPLFSENVSRGIFSAALATRRTGDEIDVHRLIREIVRGKGIRNLPRYPAATLDKGCQLLLDYRHSMTPFWEDLNSLVGQVSEVLAPEAIQVFSFDADPSRAYRWTPDQKIEGWHPNKRPVMAATDFGIQGRGEGVVAGSSWAEFISHCEANGSPLLILVPWPRERWPTDLGGYPELIHWSPYTTAAMIRQTIGLGGKIAP